MKTESWILTLLIAVIALGPLACGESPTSPGKIAGDPITTLSAVRDINSLDFNKPAQIQYSNGALWIAGYYGYNLMKMDPSGSLIQNITNYKGTNFYYPWGVTTDPNGNVFLADYYNNAVEVFDQRGKAVTQVDPSRLTGSYPIGVVATSDALYVLPYYSYMGIFVFPIKGTAVPIFGNPTTICAGLFSNDPYSLRMDGTGNLWIADHNNYRLIEVNPHGTVMRYITNGGSSFHPSDMAFDQGNNIYVTDDTNSDIVIFKANGDLVTTINSGGLSEPEGITTDKQGTFYVSDYGHSRVVVYH